MIFWQTARTARQARPRVSLPTARAHGEALEIIVDTAEKYAYSFGHQQASTSRRRLPVGDYAVEIDEEIVAGRSTTSPVHCCRESSPMRWRS
jgi:ERCC4-type nuclease